MRWIAAAMALALAGCGSDDSASEGGTPVDEGPAIDFTTGEYELAPGEENYLCYTMKLPADREVVITDVIPKYGAGTHHIFFAWTLAPEPEGVSECPVLFKVTWIPLYLGGVESGPLNLPDGAGFHMPPGQQLLVQLHLQNTTPQPLRDRVTMRMLEAEAGTTLVPAGIFGMDNRVIDVAPGAKGVKTSMECDAHPAMDVFAVLGHMHKYGNRLDVRRLGPAPEPLFGQDWSFDEQPTIPLTLRIEENEKLGLECLHSNPTQEPIGYGESSDDEMCAFVFYYTPWQGLNGCVHAATPAP